MHVIRREEDGALFCQDGRWRTFAHFGTFSSCVKVWRKLGFAKRRVDRLIGSGNDVYILSIPPGQGIDAAGMIFDISS